MATLRRMRSDQVDATRPRGGDGASAFPWGWRRSCANARDGTLPDDHFVDLRYADLMREPIATIRAIYAQLDLPLSDAIAERMRDYLAAKPRGAHGEHGYALEDFGIDPGRLRARYAAYVERFAVPLEDR